MTGPAPLFEGDMGFFQQVSGPFEVARLGGSNAEDWMLPKTSIKFVPAEYHSQSAIAAAFTLRDRIGDVGRIVGLKIETFKVAVEIIGQDPEKWRPQTRETADHSLPYCTAVALLDGMVSAAQFSPARLADPRLLDLVARTVVVEDPALTAGYPAGIPNRVTVTLDDGSTLVEEVAFPPGHDKNPLTDAGLAAKFHGLVDPALGHDRARAIIDRLGRIESDPRPETVVALLDPAGALKTADPGQNHGLGVDLAAVLGYRYVASRDEPGGSTPGNRHPPIGPVLTDEGTFMLFNTFQFAYFFAILFPLYWMLPHRPQNLLLLAASYYFYSCWDPRFLALLLISTAMDYACGIAVDRIEAPRKRKAFVALSMLLNLGMLGYFKYYNFFRRESPGRPRPRGGARPALAARSGPADRGSRSTRSSR